jgi:signal transduction histidine kinase
VFLVCDRRKIAMLLVALLRNANKFTPAGVVRVSVSTRNDRVVYRVVDTGIGIPESMHQLVFDEFRQVDGSTTRRYGGSGLGLSLAQRLAHVLGGAIDVESSPGEGSTFRVDLPIEYREPNRA